MQTDCVVAHTYIAHTCTHKHRACCKLSALPTPNLPNTCTHARTHARTYVRTYVRTHTHMCLQQDAKSACKHEARSTRHETKARMPVHLLRSESMVAISSLMTFVTSSATALSSLVDLSSVSVVNPAVSDRRSVRMSALNDFFNSPVACASPALSFIFSGPSACSKSAGTQSCSCDSTQPANQTN